MVMTTMMLIEWMSIMVMIMMVMVKMITIMTIMIMLTMILRMIADTVREGAGRKIVVEKSTVPVKIQKYMKTPKAQRHKDIKTKPTTMNCSWLNIRLLR